MLVGFIFMSFALYLVFIFFAIFFARVNVFAGISVVSLWFLGIISVCPFEIGFISKIAVLSLFWSIIIDGDSLFAIEQNMHTDSLVSGRIVGSFFSGIFSCFDSLIGMLLISFATFINSSWEVIVLFSMSVSSYSGMTLSIVWSITFAALVVISFGLNFSNIFPPISKASSCASFEGSSLCFFGIISVCPFEIGFMSKIAIELEFSAIFIDGDCSLTIEQKMQEDFSSSRCVS